MVFSEETKLTLNILRSIYEKKQKKAVLRYHTTLHEPDFDAKDLLIIAGELNAYKNCIHEIDLIFMINTGNDNRPPATVITITDRFADLDITKDD